MYTDKLLKFGLCCESKVKEVTVLLVDRLILAHINTAPPIGVVRNIKQNAVLEIIAFIALGIQFLKETLNTGTCEFLDDEMLLVKQSDLNECFQEPIIVLLEVSLSQNRTIRVLHRCMLKELLDKDELQAICPEDVNIVLLLKGFVDKSHILVLQVVLDNI